MTVSVVFAIAGVLALLFGVIGGGIKAKEIEIPQLPAAVRIVIIIAGLLLIGATIWLENNKAPIATTEPTQPSALALPSETTMVTATTETAQPTALPSKTQSPVVTEVITLPAQCVNAAQLVSETIPDGTVLKPGEKFTKIFEIKNIGTCRWEPGYKWVFIKGNSMGAIALSKNIESTVTPEQVISISMDLTAPSSVGTYRGDWKLQDLSGNVFGVFNDKDGSYNVSFFILIGVQN
jgi:hypothetical protein